MWFILRLIRWALFLFVLLLTFLPAALFKTHIPGFQSKLSLFSQNLLLRNTVPVHIFLWGINESRMNFPSGRQLHPCRRSTGWTLMIKSRVSLFRRHTGPAAGPCVYAQQRLHSQVRSSCYPSMSVTFTTVGCDNNTSCVIGIDSFMRSCDFFYAFCKMYISLPFWYPCRPLFSYS